MCQQYKKNGIFILFQTRNRNIPPSGASTLKTILFLIRNKTDFRVYILVSWFDFYEILFPVFLILLAHIFIDLNIYSKAFDSIFYSAQLC